MGEGGYSSGIYENEIFSETAYGLSNTAAFWRTPRGNHTALDV